MACFRTPAALKIGGFTFAAVIAALPRPALAADSLTWDGLTLYGTVDIGVANQNHGAPLNRDFYTGLAYIISKNSNRAITSIAPNGLSQSKIGLKGAEEIAGGVGTVFTLETGFNPESARLSDALASLVHNNGRALQDQQTGADGSRAGQAFNGPAFAGLSSPRWGTLTFGRHNTLLTDAVVRYDPVATSYAFSVLGASGATAGGGDTQDVRLDGSLKYTVTYGRFHGGALYQPGYTGGSPGRGLQFDVGAELGRVSIDLLYAAKKDAINAASLSAAQLTMPGIPQNSLAATISDNEAASVLVAYRVSKALKLSGGYVHIRYADPSHPLAPGFDGLGGYRVSFVNNTAFPHHRILQVSWLGANYDVNRRLSLIGAWYHYNQNSYGIAACSGRSAATCSGPLNAYSAVVDEKIVERFDVYAGIMYSKVAGGLSSGYLHEAAYSTMAGVRLQF